MTQEVLVIYNSVVRAILAKTYILKMDHHFHWIYLFIKFSG